MAQRFIQPVVCRRKPILGTDRLADMFQIRRDCLMELNIGEIVIRFEFIALLEPVEEYRLTRCRWILGTPEGSEHRAAAWNSGQSCTLRIQDRRPILRALRA